MNPKSAPLKTDMPEIIITTTSINNAISKDIDDQSSADGRNIELAETRLTCQESNDKFFFSNMLRSLIPKTRQIQQTSSVKKFRTGITDKPKISPMTFEKGMNKSKLKRGLNEELKKCVQPPLSSSPQHSHLYRDSPLWSPLTLPWFWPPTDLQNSCFLPTGIWESSHSVLCNGQRLVGKVWRDVPLEHLLRHHNQNPLELTSSTITSRRRVRKRSPFRQQTLAIGSRFRSHHSSAFSTPQRMLPKCTDKDMKALDLSVSAVVQKEKTAPNVHYVMSNLRNIFKDIDVDSKQSSNASDGGAFPSKSDQHQHEENNTKTAGQYSPNCKKFSALIGLEIVVDYVKQTDHS